MRASRATSAWGHFSDEVFARHRCRRPRQRGTVLHAGRWCGPRGRMFPRVLFWWIKCKNGSDLKGGFGQTGGWVGDGFAGGGNFYGGSSPHGSVVGGEAMFAGWCRRGLVGGRFVDADARSWIGWQRVRAVRCKCAGLYRENLGPEHTDTGTTAKGGRCFAAHPQGTQQYLEKCPWTEGNPSYLSFAGTRSRHLPPNQKMIITPGGITKSGGARIIKAK